MIPFTGLSAILMVNANPVCQLPGSSVVFLFAIAAAVGHPGIAIPPRQPALRSRQNPVQLGPRTLDTHGRLDPHVVPMAIVYRPIDQLPGPILQRLDGLFHVTRSSRCCAVDEVVERAVLATNALLVGRVFPGS